MYNRTALLVSLVVLLIFSGVASAADVPAATRLQAADAGPAQAQDTLPPDTTLDLGAPTYQAEDLVWVSPFTTHTLIASDNVDAPSELVTRYRYYRVSAAGGPPAFSDYVNPFTLTGFGGAYRIEFFSVDTSNNTEDLNARSVYLDATAPVVAWVGGAPLYVDDLAQEWVTDETTHTLSAEDPTAFDGSPGSGVDEIWYRIRGGDVGPSAQYVPYTGPFTIEGPDGLYQIDYYALDNVGNQSQTSTKTVSLDTTPPAAQIGGPYVGDEGSTFTFDASATADAGAGLAELVWDLDGDGVFDDEVGPTATRTYADNGSAVIGIRVTDHLGNSDIASTTVDVRNVDPTVTVTEISTTLPYPGQVVTLRGNFADAGWEDTHAAVVDWGDGETTEATVTELNEPPAAAGTFEAQHTYSSLGVFSIVVTVTDDDGGSTTASTQAEVTLSPQMPGTLIATDEVLFYRLTGTVPNTWGASQWQWYSGVGNPWLWWYGVGQGYMYLFIKSPNDAPTYDASLPTEPWSNYLTIAVGLEDFQRWFWCGIPLYDDHYRFLGYGCHPDYAPVPDGRGEIPGWLAERLEQGTAHVGNIVYATFQQTP